MNGLEKIASMFGRLAANAETVSEKSIEETKDEFLRLNKDQLYHGETITGESLGFYRSRQYAIKKNRMNSLPGLGVKDNFLTGAYYKGFTLEIKGAKLFLFSTDPKAKKLEKDKDQRYGLNDSNQSIYIKQSLSPALIKNILSEFIIK